MAALNEIGSFSANVQANEEIIDLIFNDIEAKTGLKLTRRELRHATFYGQDGDLLLLNNHYQYELKNGEFSTPNNNNSTLIVLKSIKMLQPGAIEIYFLR